MVSLKLLKEFWQRYPDAQTPLKLWYKTAQRAAWSGFHDVRKTYRRADSVRVSDRDTLTVFNIGGNKYRLVVRIRYDYQLINVRAVMTHEEYSKEKWKE